MWYCWREEYYGSMVEVKRKAAGCVGGSKRGSKGRAAIVAKQQRHQTNEGTLDECAKQKYLYLIK